MRRQLAPGAQLQQLGAIALAVYIILAGTGAFWRVEIGTPRLLLLSLLAAGFGWIAWKSGWLALLLILLPPAILPLLVKIPRAPRLLVSYLNILQEQVAQFITDLRIEGPTATFGMSLGILLLALIGMGVGAVAARESLGRGRAFVTLMLGSIIFGSQWAFFWEPAAGYGAAFAAVALLLWVLAGSGQREAVWAESGRKVQYRTPITAPLASVLVVALGARLLPADFLPSTASLFESITEGIPFLEQMRGNQTGGDFGLISTGFSPNGSTLGGPVTLSDTPALELRMATPLNETLYLRGAAYEQFNGSRWEQAPLNHAGYSTVETVQSYLHPEAFRREQRIEIRQLQSFGRSLFSPAEPYKVDGLAWEVDGTHMLRATKAVRRGASYTLDVKLPDWSTEQIRLFERQAFGMPISEELTESPGAGFSDQPFGTGPVLPPGVDPFGFNFNVNGSTRVLRDYTTQLLGRSLELTPYEKAVALESYLRNTFPYDLKAPAPRPGQNFVQFFLFEAQRGYCTYFASAMTLMLQLSGVQARYVEGYALPASTPLTRGADGSAAYVVNNAMAHAWVEAWIPGYGWVTFDPTPRADIPLTDRSRPLVTPQVPLGGDVTPRADPTDPNDRPTRDPREIEDEGEVGVGGGIVGSTGPNWSLIGLLGALLALLGLALLRLRLQVPRPALTGRAGVTESWSKAESLLHRFGWGRKSAQTPQEWAVHVGERVRDLQEPLQTAAEDYALARWGPPGAAAEEPARAAALWALVTQAMRQRYGGLAYLWRRLRLAPKRK